MNILTTFSRPFDTCWSPFGSFLLDGLRCVQYHGSQRKAQERQSEPLAPFWVPFGSLLVPFGSLLVPFGSLWNSFGSILEPFSIKFHVSGVSNFTWSLLMDLSWKMVPKKLPFHLDAMTLLTAFSRPFQKNVV